MYAFPHHRGQSICSPGCAEQSEKKTITSIVNAHILNDGIFGNRIKERRLKEGEE